MGLGSFDIFSGKKRCLITVIKMSFLDKAKKKEGAEANLKILQTERAKLDAQFQSEVNLLETKTDPLAEDFTKTSITLVKANISVRLVTLVWTVI